jgi:hypothetical protein
MCDCNLTLKPPFKSFNYCPSTRFAASGQAASLKTFKAVSAVRSLEFR